MRHRQSGADRRRAREFETFVAGAAGRLLHVATLLTGEPAGSAPRAEELLTAALARTYADWDRVRGEDPYDRTRQEIATRYAHGAWRRRASGGVPGSVLDRLGSRERLILVLRLYEGVAEEQTAALMGLSVERVRAVFARAVTTMRAPAPAPTAARGPAPAPAPARTPAPAPTSAPAPAPTRLSGGAP